LAIDTGGADVERLQRGVKSGPSVADPACPVVVLHGDAAFGSGDIDAREAGDVVCRFDAGRHLDGGVARRTVVGEDDFLAVEAMGPEAASQLREQIVDRAADL